MYNCVQVVKKCQYKKYDKNCAIFIQEYMSSNVNGNSPGIYFVQRIIYVRPLIMKLASNMKHDAFCRARHNLIQIN